MRLTPVITASIERLLNGMIYREPALKMARQRVQGRVLHISLQEFSTPLILVFSAQRLDVLTVCKQDAEAQIITRLAVLAKLRDRQQLTALIRSGELQVQGDIRLVQDVVALLDLVLDDWPYWLSLKLGDVGAHVVSQVLLAGTGWLTHHAKRAESYLAQSITDEWRLAPGRFEACWLADETTVLADKTKTLTHRLDKLEGK